MTPFDRSETRESLRRLLRPRSVAVVGASADLERFNGRVLKNLLRHGFPGRVYPVNPKYEEAAGLRCWPSLAEVPETPDTAFIAVGRDRVLGVVEECLAKGVPTATIYTGGFSEAGGEGDRLEREIASAAAAGGLRICGPNTAGVHDFHGRVHLAGIIALELDRIQPGPVGVVCQSGSIGGALLSRATHRGIGFSYMISCGNEMDLEVADYVDFLIEDPGTRAVAVYLEGLRDGEKFLRAAERALEAGKPIVVLKVGRAGPGRAAALSHTGALVGEDCAYEAVFRQWGIARVNDLEALFEVGHMFATTPLPGGRRVGIVSTTGGGGALMADAMGLLGLEVPPPGEGLRDRIGGLLHASASPANPIDTTIAGIEAYEELLRAVLADDSFDLVNPIVGSSAQFRPQIGVAPVLRSKREGWAGDRPLLVYLNPHAEEAHRLLAGAGIASFQSISGCAGAAAHLVRYAERRRRLPARRGGAAARAVPEEAVPLLGRGGVLDEAQSLALAGAIGIPAVPFRLCGGVEEAARVAAEMGYPVILKGVSRDVPHKTEAGMVSPPVADEGALREAHGRMAERVRLLRPLPRLEGLLVQKVVEGGVEFMLGVVQDPQFGPVVTVGRGGTTAEVMDDLSARIAPLTREEAEAMIGELRSAPLLGPFRGREPLDRGALAEAIVRLGDFAAALGGRLREADLNPVFVLPAGAGCRAADGMFVLEGEGDRP